MNKYIPVIGLEIHAELATTSKMFCGCPADWFGKEPNTHTCPVCLGMPGALPVPNKKAVEWTIKLARALNCTINKESKFDRKHYFYPDLPKGYQISQYDQPIGVDGTYQFIYPAFSKDNPIRIRRVHLEEDAGKLSHEDDHTHVDLNRAGVPLVEIVTEPDFSDTERVKTFLEELQILVRMLGVSDANMEEGSMRLEPNISLKVAGTTELPNYKVEIKNINSFRFAKKAIEYELTRQSALLQKGELPRQETRGYDDAQGKTISQRSKEEAHDYRYFPEPDIPPMIFDEALLKRLEPDADLLPSRVFTNLTTGSLSSQDAYTLLKNDKKRELLLKLKNNDAILSLNLEKPLVSLASILINKKISLEQSEEEIAVSIITFLKPKETDKGKLKEVVEIVLKEQTKAVEEYKSGKTTVIMFLVGQVMKHMAGTADATEVKKAIEDRLQ